MNFKKGALAAAIVTAVSLGTIGCADRDQVLSVSQASANATAANEALSTELTKSATSGTAITVADGYASGCTVTSGTLTAQATSALGQYLFLGKPSAEILATGCVDAHTGVSLPPLKAPAPTTTAGQLDLVNVTPITTMVAAVGETKAAAILGIPVADLKKDPVGDTTLSKVAAKIVAVSKVVTTASSTVTDPIASLATQAGNSTKTLDDTVKDTALLTNIVGAAAANSVSTLAQQVATAINSATTVDDAAKVAAIASGLKEGETVAAKTASVTLNAAGLTTTKISTTTIATVASTLVTQIVQAVLAGTANISAIAPTAVSLASAAQSAQAALTAAQTAAGTGATGSTGSTQ